MRARAGAFVANQLGPEARREYEGGDVEALVNRSLERYEGGEDAWNAGLSAAAVALGGAALKAKVAATVAKVSPYIAVFLAVYAGVRWLIENTIPRTAGTLARWKFTVWVFEKIDESLAVAGVPPDQVQAMRAAIAPAIFTTLAPTEAGYVTAAVDGEDECHDDAWFWVADCPDDGVGAARRWFRPIGADVRATIDDLVGAMVRPEPSPEAMTDWWQRPRAASAQGGGLLAPLALVAAVWAGSRWL